jgi:hypothetical protein
MGKCHVVRPSTKLNVAMTFIVWNKETTMVIVPSSSPFPSCIISSREEKTAIRYLNFIEHIAFRMFGFHFLGICLLAASPNDFEFQDSRLQMAVDVNRDAQQLVTDGKHKEACQEFMSGISIGRTAVQRLQERHGEGESDADNPELALDWLVSSYISLFRARVEVGDWEKARADAWAACSYSLYKNLEALYCMLSVCENTEDKIGELQTLKSIISASSSIQESYSDGDANRMSTDEVHERIRLLEKELESK